MKKWSAFVTRERKRRRLSGRHYQKQHGSKMMIGGRVARRLNYPLSPAAGIARTDGQFPFASRD
jgi:hypothetical protein